MRKITISLSAELLAAIDAARAGRPMAPWLESRLRSDRQIKAAAKAAAITLPEREPDRRGGDRRKRGEA